MTISECSAISFRVSQTRGAGFADIGRQPPLAIDEELVPALDQVEGHRMPHDPEPDKTDFHDPSCLRPMNRDRRTVLQLRPKAQAPSMRRGQSM